MVSAVLTVFPTERHNRPYHWKGHVAPWEKRYVKVEVSASSSVGEMLGVFIYHNGVSWVLKGEKRRPFVGK